MSIPRNEYPRPLLVREDWINLNGEWDFETDNSITGTEKGFFGRASLDGKIIVPFCPESVLSGVGNTDFMNCVWYRRSFELPKSWSGKRVLLNFGAVDYHATVYVNGAYVGEHKGGYTPFTFDITEHLSNKGNYITLCAKDDLRSGNQPAGKQSHLLNSHGCFYTRTTGIWQTVWLECVSDNYIQNIKSVADTETCSVNLEIKLSPCSAGARVTAKAFFEGNPVGESSVKVGSFSAFLNIALQETHLWEVGKGNLYDLEITVEKNGETTDRVSSYFGLRSVCLTEKAFLLNGRSVFGRWVLDQGFYPDGIYTAPSDEALKNDILYSMRLGFNGARLHEKLFEPRFLYWADKLGYMVWGEHGNWGLNITEVGQIEHFLPEWIEAVERDFSHPCIIGWCPLNETWDYNGKPQSDTLVKMVYDVTKSLDSTRPVIDTSGNFHVVTDIFDIHDYCQDVSEFASHYKDSLYNNFPHRQTHRGEPYFISEYGGIKWAVDNSDGWGYGDGPKTEKEFVERYKGLTNVLLNNENIFGFCYTQLYDVEQEVNGLMTYDRKFKFDPEVFKKINTQKAAIEE
ncbi:MAG: beta-galactosidase [Firmicutes bacterium HGW-Firmicutes-21]|nr:MAG: beta-galactosidase [Firmicutes bacterium HGW-Firmicutes-21]